MSATALGYPRIGGNRELKRATEQYWAGAITTAQLLTVGADLRRRNWQAMAARGLYEVPVNDFSFYDHVADTIQLADAVPQRHRVPSSLAGSTQQAGHAADDARVAEYFAMARGSGTAAPLEMTKWFDTNYHYLIPELAPETVFRLASDKPLAEAREAQLLGLQPRPVLLGPVTFLELAKPAPGHAEQDWRPLELLAELLPVYEQLLIELADLKVDWVQLDEPILAADPDPAVLQAAEQALTYLSSAPRRPNLMVATYFGTVEAALPLLQHAPIEGVGLDFTGPAADNLSLLAEAGGLPDKRLFAGVIDGRNVWANDLAASLSTLRAACPFVGQVTVATSCSLLHVPLDLGLEPDREADRETGTGTGIPTQVRPWLAFAEQKLDELTTLARAVRNTDADVQATIAAARQRRTERLASPLTRVPAVRERTAAITDAEVHRPEPRAERAVVQQERFALPLLPTTTIGSFPQTPGLRDARAELRRGTLTAEAYRQRIGAEIAHVIGLQEDIGLDVLVHGEPERNDMVQYFAEQLTGFLATQYGWVQSYGTRYVRPPILLGDVARPAPMTVQWARYAQSLTSKPVKGMLTGPVTMLAWSFVRDDQPLQDSAQQIALALREEVADLQAAGIGIIQLDEPALRELLPLKQSERAEYLRWACEAFRLATSGVRADTQIHTHMCYAEFGDIAEAIADLDVDVISLEAARSHSTTTEDIAGPHLSSTNGTVGTGHTARYAVGPGVYDIHAPRVPPTVEISAHLHDALRVIPVDRLWVNPDCGLKTRTESEVSEALRNMVTAARQVRETLDRASTSRP